MSYGFIKAVPQSLSHDRDYATNELDKTGSIDLRNKHKPDRALEPIGFPFAMGHTQKKGKHRGSA